MLPPTEIVRAPSAVRGAPAGANGKGAAAPQEAAPEDAASPRAAAVGGKSVPDNAASFLTFLARAAGPPAPPPTQPAAAGKKTPPTDAEKTDAKPNVAAVVPAAAPQANPTAPLHAAGKAAALPSQTTPRTSPAPAIQSAAPGDAHPAAKAPDAAVGLNMQRPAALAAAGEAQEGQDPPRSGVSNTPSPALPTAVASQPLPTADGQTVSSFGAPEASQPHSGTVARGTNPPAAVADNLASESSAAPSAITVSAPAVPGQPITGLPVALANLGNPHDGAGKLGDPGNTLTTSDTPRSTAGGGSAGPHALAPAGLTAADATGPTGLNDSPRPAAPPSVADQLAAAFVARSALLTRDGRADFYLRLEPPQLGTIHVYLTAADHTVSARVVVTQESTQALLQGQAERLRQALAQAGVTLGGFDVKRDGGNANGHWKQAPPEPPGQGSQSRPPPARPTPALRSAPAADGIDLLA